MIHRDGIIVETAVLIVARSGEGGEVAEGGERKKWSGG
jgi:hypothetical protein